MKEGLSHSIAIHNDTVRPHDQFLPVRMIFPGALANPSLPWVAIPEGRIVGPLCERITLPPVAMSEHRSQKMVQDYIFVEDASSPYKQTSLHMSPRLFIPAEIGEQLQKKDVSEIMQMANFVDLSLTTDGITLSKNGLTTKKDLFTIDHTTGRGIAHPALGSETLVVSNVDPEILATGMAHEQTKTQTRNKFRTLLWEGVQYDRFGRQQIVAAYYQVDYPSHMLHTVPYCNLVIEMTDPKKYNGEKLHTFIDPAIIVEYV